MSFVHIDTFTLDRCFPTNSEREREREKENCQLISWERERERMTINTYIYKERTTIHFVHCIETESCYRFCKMFFSLLYRFQLYSQQLRFLPYWWSSETLQVGLWRARSVSSTWLLVEPQIETEDGKKKHEIINELNLLLEF